MYQSFTALLCLFMIHTSSNAQPAHSLTIGEGFQNPLGFHDASPTFSWKLPAGVQSQSACRIEAKSNARAWDSGWLETNQSTLVSYSGEPFTSREKVDWRVNYRDENGKEAGWSSWAFFELGLLSSSEWKAQWIRPAEDDTSSHEYGTWLRRGFGVKAKVARARVYVTAHGIFELQLNGLRIGRDHFANGWTSYTKRLDSLTYDVTELLREGDNLLGAQLGHGWYSGRLAWGNDRNHYGAFPALLLQLEITYADGTAETISSDSQWQGTHTGPILSSSIYDGEDYDARTEVSGWGPVTVGHHLGSAQITPKPFAPVREKAKLPVQKITQPQPGHFVFDLGQNMVGWARLKMPVQKDQKITIRFAEMLNPDGTLYTANYRSARSTDTYIGASDGVIEWEPHFTFHGFRYVELTGLAEGTKPAEDWVTGIVLSSDLEPAGKFESSHAKLNQLQSNIVWGQRGNFLDIPTDCPQRNERLGWTGDAQVFCPTSMFNYNCTAFWKSWLGSMRDDQSLVGAIPHVIPDVLREGAGSPGWTDAATVIPWEVYVRTGDVELLSENFPMMEKLVAWYRSQSTNGITEKMEGYGDWLQPYAKATQGDTSKPLLGTAFYAYSARLLAESARVLNRTEDAQRYSAEADSVKNAFVRYFFDAEGKLQNASETQTSYLLALAFDLLPEAIRKKVGEHLVRLVHAADDHLRTGFLGTPYIVRVLDQLGYSDLAVELLLKESYPSWFYSINQGATTMWERWNSYSHDHGFGDAGMNSFNHYAYGAIGQWMYERLAGLAPDPAQPGYRHFFVRPLLTPRLDSARAELETPYGKAASGWARKEGKVVLEVTVPPNTSATIEFPDKRPAEKVSAGSHRFEL